MAVVPHDPRPTAGQDSRRHGAVHERRRPAEYDHYTGPDREPWRLTRRSAGIKLLAAGFLVRARGLAWAHKAVAPTPSTGRGPFYPVDDGEDRGNDLVAMTSTAPRGDLLEITGRVLDTEGAPVAGAGMVFWQADDGGVYDHPSARSREIDPGFGYWGKARTDSGGSWSLRTVVPGHYRINGRYRPNHVHVEITAEGYRTLPTEMHFDGDPYAANDFVTTLAQHEQLKMSTQQHASLGAGWLYSEFDIVLRSR